MRRKTKLILVLAILFSVGTTTSYLALAEVGIFDGAGQYDSRLSNDESVSLLQPEPEEAFNVGFTVQRNGSETPGAYVVADIIVDDDFIVTNGDDWRDDITEMMAGANGLLGQVGVEIRIGSVGIWVSDEGAGSLRELIESAEMHAQRDPSRLLIVITCQDSSQKDGLAQRSRGRVIVEYYHQDVPRNSALLTHEIGHLFGAGHHEDAVECVGDGCIMDEKGYEHEEEWCDHHRDLILGNVQAALTTPNNADPASPDGNQEQSW